MVLVESMQGTGFIPVLFRGVTKMIDEKKDNSKEKRNSIWKLEHTPLGERRTSSGITFRCKEVVVDDEQERSELY